MTNASNMVKFLQVSSESRVLHDEDMLWLWVDWQLLGLESPVSAVPTDASGAISGQCDHGLLVKFRP